MSQPSVDPVAAIAANHRRWFAARAERMGAPSFRVGGVVVHAGATPTDECHLPFPDLDAARAGAQLDAALAFARAERPQGSLLVWGMDEDRALGVRLMARGLRRCFRTHWMWRELPGLPPSPPDVPSLEYRANPGVGAWTRWTHPYFGDATLAIEAEARMVAHPAGDTLGVVAWQADRPVGAAVAHLTDQNGTAVAGIYNVGVVPEARGRGIGGAVTDAICRLARERGASYAGLNATPMGEPVYRRLGFQSHGWGQTWNTPGGGLGHPPVEPDLIAWTEAIGFGEIFRMGTAPFRPDGAGFDAPLPCGLTPVQFAAYALQPAAMEQLLSRDATLDPLSAWDLGWRDRIPAIVAADPSLRRFPVGEAGGTPLHQAVLRDDPELVAALLAAGAETDGRDPTYRSTPLGWAEHMGRGTIAELLRRYGAAT